MNVWAVMTTEENQDVGAGAVGYIVSLWKTRSAADTDCRARNERHPGWFTVQEMPVG